MRYAFFAALFSLLTHGLWAEAPEKATAGSKSAPGKLSKSDSAYIPTLDVVRDKCAKEHPKKCLKRRCVPALSYYAWLTRGEKDTRSPEVKKLLGDFSAPIDPWPLKESIKDLKKAFGDDWQAARDAMLAAWEVLLYAIETGKMDTLADLFEYPTIFTLETGNIRNMWVRWEVQNKAELKRLLFYVLRPLIKNWIFLGPRCGTITPISRFGGLFFGNGKMCFEIKKLTEGANKGRYQLIFNRIIIQSDNFFGDIGKTRHELKRRGIRSPARPYP